MGMRSQMSKEFFDAIKQGNLYEVQRLFFLNYDLIYEKENGLSPIMVAAYHHQPEIVDFLCDKTVTLNIFEAVTTGKINQVARHLARDPMLANAYSSDGFQPLGLASFFGQYEIAEYLIKAGAVVNSPSKNALGATPIQSAAAAGQIKIVQLLLENNANPNSKENNGFTPLHTAAQNGNTPLIRTLLFNGADMNVHSNHGELPVDLAVEGGHTEAAALLKEGITRRFRPVRPSHSKN
jgi:uncharacterized protein